MDSTCSLHIILRYKVHFLFKDFFNRNLNHQHLELWHHKIHMDFIPISFENINQQGQWYHSKRNVFVYPHFIAPILKDTTELEKQSCEA